MPIDLDHSVHHDDAGHAGVDASAGLIHESAQAKGAKVDLYGPGGSNLQGLGALAEDEAKAAQRATNRRPDRGRWPSVRTVVLSAGVLSLAVVVFGWILTALNG